MAPRRTGRGRTRIGRLVLAAIVVLVAGAAALALLRPWAAPPSPVALAPAPTDGCRKTPAFTGNPALGLGGGLLLATDQEQKGLVLVATAGGGKSYQHPTWDDAGYLGAIAYDGDGNIYAAPTPRQSLVDNPLAGATTLWRVDGTSGAMEPFVTLPGAATERNPFGVLGLTYACAINAIYAATVIGSTPMTAHGGVVAIGRDGQIRGVALADTDVMGVLVVRVGAGYELYAGLARSPQIVAVPLNEQGVATGPARPLIDLTTAGAAPSERARKLRIVADELVAELVPFNFSLQGSASAQAQIRRATWRYDQAAVAWVVSRTAVAP